MKFKFRAEKKDIIIFIIFCVMMLYFVAIAVLNLVKFATTNTFHGLNPLPAFGPEYLTQTMIFFFIAMTMILTSVSSYFFEREKGFGVTTSKKEKDGYSRWAKEKEMKAKLKLVSPTAETADHAGIALINNGKELWVDDSEFHSLVIGSTGSGKTTLVVLPLVQILAKKGESMIITDPKGEIYRDNAEMLRAKGYNVMVLNFRDPDLGSAWNPLMLPYLLYQEGNKDKAIELLDDLAINILYDETAQGQDPFWEKTAADYFVGLALALFEDADQSKVNLNSINYMSTVGEERFRSKTYLHEYFSTKDPGSPMYVNVASALNAPTETKGSILSVFKQKIKLFSSREKVSEMLSHSSIDMKSIGRERTAVFLIVQDEKKTYHPLVTTFIKQCYETLIDVAQENGGSLKYRTNFILDEFANMPPLKDVTTMITAARSRLIRFTLIIQNFAQLYQVYGKENGETIKGNCGNIIYLISSELSALEEISKMAGEVKSKEKEKTSSTPLVTVSDLQRLSMGETIILRTREMPFKTKLTFSFKMDWGKTYPKAVFNKREMKSVEIFDLKKHVEEKAKEKTNLLYQNATAPVKPEPVLTPPPGNNFDVDELVKRIDARIAELEEEEKKESESKKMLESVSKEEPLKEVPVTTNIEPEMESKPIIEEKTIAVEPHTVESNIKVGDEVVGKPISSYIEEDKENVPVKVETFKPELVAQNEPEPVIEQPKVVEKTVASKNEKELTETKEDAISDDQFFDDFFSDDEE